MHRSILIIPAPCKILKKIIHDALWNFLIEHNILPNSRYGFLPECSVTMGLVSAKSKGNFVWILAFHLSYAFDTINPTKLIKRLQNAGVGRPLQWIKSYMSGRKQPALWNVLSNSCPLTHGVPQGSILGPLFSLLRSKADSS